MLKKLVCLLLVCAIAAGIAGCDAISRKFTRKKEIKKEPYMFYTPALTEQQYPNADLYKRHYVYWKTLVEDLITHLGENSKRDRQTFDDAIGNLRFMARYITGDDNIKILNKRINELENIAGRGARIDGNDPQIGVIRSGLESHMRAVDKKFMPHKMEKYFKPNEK